MSKKASVILDHRGDPYQERGRPASGGVGGQALGGIVNYGSGMGTGVDKSQGSFFTPTRIYWRSPMEILYIQSWAARKFCDIPVDDMFLRWRTWSDGEDMEGSADAMRDAERTYKVAMKLNAAMWAARLHGGALAVMMLKDGPMTSELLPERIREGDFMGFRVFDRFDVQVIERETDPMNPDADGPLIYQITPSRGGSTFPVHASRVLRFDGIKRRNSWGFEAYYDYDWGVSELVPAILSFLEDQSLATSVSHLTQEASISILRVESLRQLVAGERAPDEPSVEEIGERINVLKSNFRLLVLDREHEDFERESVNFGGLADLMDRFANRLAAAADIPATRFQGRSPMGMSATGESDMKNYVMMIEARRENRLEHILPQVDMVLARNAGFEEPPPYEFRSLLDLSEKDVAEAATLKVKALSTVLKDNVIGEEEYRRQLDGDPIFGSLPEEDLPEPEPEPEPAPILPGPLGAPVPGPPAPPPPVPQK